MSVSKGLLEQRAITELLERAIAALEDTALRERLILSSNKIDSHYANAIHQLKTKLVIENIYLANAIQNEE